MNYPPKHHQDNDIDHMIDVIENYPLATVISVEDNEPIITHLPLIYNEDGNLIGHIDKFNPHAELLKEGKDVTILFSGPQCYISPSIYGTKQLPTWNYVKVHLKGKVTAIEDAKAIKHTIVKMTEFLERPNHRYELRIDDSRMDALIDYVKGFQITITHWEGKFKLSQDKKPSDIANAKVELIRANQESIESFLDKII